jgi:two-component system chemotaxis response regulator CheB
MGRDGAKDLKSMRDAGARTIGQDEATSVVYGMPKVAHELGAVERQVPLDRVADAIALALTARAHQV